MDEVTGERRKLHNEKLCDLYSSPSIIGMIKSRTMRWVGYVARMGGRETRIGYWWEIQRERTKTKTLVERLKWTGLVWLRIGAGGGLL
jgi:hypothetical protein